MYDWNLDVHKCISINPIVANGSIVLLPPPSREAWIDSFTGSGEVWWPFSDPALASLLPNDFDSLIAACPQPWIYR
jgi:hypothetical protein